MPGSIIQPKAIVGIVLGEGTPASGKRLMLECSPVGCASKCFLKDDLANPDPRVQGDREGAGIEQFQYLLIGHARLDEAGCDMHHQTDPGKPTPPLDPTADGRREGNFLHGYSQHCFVWPDDQMIVNGYDITVGIGVKPFAFEIDGIPGRTENPECSSQCTVNACGSDCGWVERIDGNYARINPGFYFVMGKDGHTSMVSHRDCGNGVQQQSGKSLFVSGIGE